MIGAHSFVPHKTPTQRLRTSPIRLATARTVGTYLCDPNHSTEDLRLGATFSPFVFQSSLGFESSSVTPYQHVSYTIEGALIDDLRRQHLTSTTFSGPKASSPVSSVVHGSLMNELNRE